LADPSCVTWDVGQFNGHWVDFTTSPSLRDTGRFDDSSFYGLLKVRETDACTLKVELKTVSNGTGSTENLIIPDCDGEYAAIAQRDSKAGDNINYNKATYDSSYCIITTNNATNGQITYFAADTTSTLGLNISNSYMSGEFGFEINQLRYRPSDGHYNGSYRYGYWPIVGNLPVDTIGKYKVFPLFMVDHDFDVDVNDTTYFLLENFDTLSGSGAIESLTVNYTLTRKTIDRATSQSDGSYKYMARYKYRLFYLKNDPNMLYWSKKYYPDSLSSSYSMNIETFDGDWITGLMVQGDFLNVYKNNSIMQIYPIAIDYSNQGQIQNFDMREATLSIGCIASKTLVNVNGIHYFLSNDGFASFNGSEHKIISEPINDWLDDSLDYENITSACGVQYEDNIWWSIPILPSTELKNEVTFLYNLPTGSWTRFDFGAGALTVNGRPTDTLDLFIGSSDSGFVFTYGGSTDGGDSIEAIIQTDYLDFGAPHLYKRSDELVISYDMPVVCNLGLSLYLDYGTTAIWLDTLTHTATYGQFRVPCQQKSYGKNISLRMTFYNAADVKIPWFEWLIRPNIPEPTLPNIPG